MTLLKTVGIFGSLGAAVGFAAAFLPLPGARLLSAPVITAALGANIGVIFGMIEGSWRGAHAESEYHNALDAQDAADAAAQDAADAAAQAAATAAAAAAAATANAAQQAAAKHRTKSRHGKGKPIPAPIPLPVPVPVPAAPQVHVQRGGARRSHATTAQS